MTYFVSVDIYRGASETPAMVIGCNVDAATELSALNVAERQANLMLADNTYAAARRVYPMIEPNPAYSAAVMAVA